jgi:tRNA dimethylallyltransferase
LAFQARSLFVIAGPTASGKSQLAINLADKINGEIINADAIQVYREIPILSCSPSKDDIKSAAHHLYNYVSVINDYSVGKYIKDAISAIHNVVERHKIPIIVGGTGMYIKALCYGIHNIPDIDIEIRKKARDKFQAEGNEKFYQELQKLDPIGAIQLHPSNSQRLIRFYEVFMQTGRSIIEFYNNEPSSFLKDYNIKTIVLEPVREVLYDKCNTRFVSMIENGAIQEVEHVRSQYNEATSASKAIGFDELSLYLDGMLSKDDAITLAQTRTRQYAKRQMTWLRHQIKDAIRVDPANSDHLLLY